MSTKELKILESIASELKRIGDNLATLNNILGKKDD